ncbi:MAG: hypothetical protein KGD58_17110 [Candidatus Lokiarchaeota archaeon]|nr:hypothetical protein [Candidatus Lokiarchaeota archaeon]
MKFNEYFKLKTKGKTVILIVLIALSLVGIISIKGNILQASLEDEEIETSAPPVIEYKYDYENDFNYYDHATYSALDATVTGDITEWSQNPDDGNRLQLHYLGWFAGGLFGGAPFDMDGGLYVESVGEFKKQGDLSLGAYVDWQIDIDLTSMIAMDLDSILITLNILGPSTFKQMISIYDMSPQEGRFYIPAFDNYIFEDGKIRFELRGRAYGQVATFHQLGGISLTLSFDGLRVIQEIKPKEQPVEKRTLIIVHGFGFTPCSPVEWDTFLTPDILEAYDTIIVINYINLFYGYIYSKSDNTWSIFNMNIVIIPAVTSIAFIALVLKDFIKLNYMHIGDKVDFLCHSMGGLVTRWMIKFYYGEIQAHYSDHGKVFDIENVCMIATPNHGVWLAAILSLFIPPFPAQILEMIGVPPSPFLFILNAFDETPYQPDISWYTYRSGFLIVGLLRVDGLVDEVSAQLNGAVNRGSFNGFDHEALRHSDMVKTIIYNDIFKPPDIIQEIFATGIPGKIIRVEDLILEPNDAVPGGKTLLSITLVTEDVEDIEKTTVEVDINPIYPMPLKPGTTGTYEVELPLEDGDYSFLMTADEHDGGTYQISGSLRIVDDDAQAPQIQIEPDVLFISDEEAEGGVEVLWEISDYSDISEATVTLNGEEIATYEDESLISDSYLIPNTLGTYTFSVSARDADDDPGHDPPGGDWLEDTIMRTYTIYDDDINPPEISISPGDLFISDGETVGGIDVSWDISDYSGLSGAIVELNGIQIASYGPTEGSIQDSYHLSNEPGVYTFEIWARDGDNDLRHDPLEQDWLDNSLQRTVTIYDDDTTGPEIGIIIIDRYWEGDKLCLDFNVTVTDPESGFGSVDINIGSYNADYRGRHYAVLDPGHYDLQIFASNGDNDRLSDTETSFLSEPIDLMPLVTTVSFGTPHLLLHDNHHITSDTEIIFSVDAVSELDSTFYKISNDIYPGEWTPYSAPLYLDLDDGTYTLEYYSVDMEGITEKIKSVPLVLDNFAPGIDIITPSPGVALQDGVTFTMEVTDLTGVEWVSISIREPGGPNGIIIDPAFEGLLATNVGGDLWQYDFDTTFLPDGFYILFVETVDHFGFYRCKTVQFAIRNWAVLELLPSTERNRAGRTMPVKFSLRVVEAVDPAMPFVWNEELDIVIYDQSKPSVILQHSNYGDTSRDYRISAEGELYITNFKTSKKPAVYVVEIWRKDMPIGSFGFETYR